MQERYNEYQENTPVIVVIREIEFSFMQSLKEVYGKERGWRMCGPASIALSRILSAKTGVPINRGKTAERIQLEVGIFDPIDSKDRLNRIEEQTYIRYHDGNGYVYYIDPIYGLLISGSNQSDGAISIEKYTENEIDTELERRHYLFSFNPNHSGISRIKGVTYLSQLKTPKDRLNWYKDSVAALNDERATLSDFVADSGKFMQTDWKKSEKIIKRFVPNWKPDLYKVAERYREYGDKVLSRNTRGVVQLRILDNIEYQDQDPRIESWGTDTSDKQKIKVLTFHISNKRYILKEGQNLEIFQNGYSLDITDDDLMVLKSAVKNSSEEVKEFINRNLR